MGTGETQFKTTDFDTGEGPSSSALPRAGDVIDQRFRVERVLGQGGMGAVLEVVHLKLNERYALKVLLPDRAADPETVARFMREARASARIKSEHVVAVNDVGQLPSGAPYILMEYLVGSDLAGVIHDRGPLPVTEAANFLLQACAGIAEAHALGFVHRDLKPSNLFLTQRSDGEPLVKILDFGIAKATIEDGHDNPRLTETRAVFGSPAYMSPEQVRSARKVDFRTDIWSLGVILYELLTGTLPFEGETAAGILAAIAADPAIPVTERRPDVSAELSALILRCLEKSPANRPQTIAELAEALAPFARGAPVSVGRIRRLSIPVSDRQLPVASSRSSEPRVAPHVGAVTDEPVTTGRSSRAGGSRWLVFGSLAVAVVAVTFAVLAQRNRASSQPENVTAAPPPATSPVPATTPPSASASPSTSAAPSSEPLSSPPEPTGSKTTPKTAPRPGTKPAPASKPPVASPSPPAPAPPPSPATPPPPAPPSDPYSTSH